MMRIRTATLAALIALSAAGCSTGPADDPAALAASESHATVASLTLAVRLRLQDRSTAAYTQVMLSDSRDALADAQRQLAVADGLDAQRRALATAPVARAVDTLAELAQAGTSALDEADLARLTELEIQLAALTQRLGG